MACLPKQVKNVFKSAALLTFVVILSSCQKKSGGNTAHPPSPPQPNPRADYQRPPFNQNSPNGNQNRTWSRQTDYFGRPYDSSENSYSKDGVQKWAQSRRGERRFQRGGSDEEFSGDKLTPPSAMDEMGDDQQNDNRALETTNGRGREEISVSGVNSSAVRVNEATSAIRPARSLGGPSGASGQQTSVVETPAPKGFQSPTGAILDSDNAYSDSRVDTLLAALKAQFDSLPDDKKMASQVLSFSINSVRVLTNMPRDRALKVILKFDGENGSDVRAEFRGSLSPNREAVLDEVGIEANDRFAFKVRLVCVDANPNTCENIVLRVDQYDREMKVVCASAFLVHRLGEVHVTYEESEYFKSLSAPDTHYGKFMEALKNTNDWVAEFNARCFNLSWETCSYLPAIKIPAFRRVEFSSWAVAYGRSYFNLAMFSVPVNGEFIQDVLYLDGHLIESRGESAVNTRVRVQGESRGLKRQYAESYTGRGRYASQLSDTSKVLANDGDGNMTVEIGFLQGGQRVKLDFHSQVLPARNFQTMIAQ